MDTMRKVVLLAGAEALHHAIADYVPRPTDAPVVIRVEPEPVRMRRTIPPEAFFGPKRSKTYPAGGSARERERRLSKLQQE